MEYNLLQNRYDKQCEMFIECLERIYLKSKKIFTICLN